MKKTLKLITLVITATLLASSVLFLAGCGGEKKKDIDEDIHEINTEQLEIGEITEIDIKEYKRTKASLVVKGEETKELIFLVNKNRILAPLVDIREYFEDATIEVEKGGKRDRLIIKRDNIELVILIDTNIFEYKVYDEEGKLELIEEKYCENSTLNYEKKLFIPIRFFSQNLGYDVQWDERKRTVYIN